MARRPRPITTKSLYVIVHPEKGVFLGLASMATKTPLWSKTFGGGITHAPTMDRRQAQRLIKAFREPRAKPRLCAPDHKGWASVDACIRAGLPAWIPDLPGAGATDIVWDAFISKLGPIELERKSFVSWRLQTERSESSSK